LSLAQTKYTNQNLKFQVGDRFPYFEKNGFAHFSNPCFHLMKIGASEKDEEKRLSAVPYPIEFINIPINGVWRNLGVVKPIYILVRPDMFIGLIMDQLSLEKICSYLE